MATYFEYNHDSMRVEHQPYADDPTLYKTAVGGDAAVEK